MLNRNLLACETYRQTGGYCVLASYAVAMKMFLNRAHLVQEFFEAYCAERKIPVPSGQGEATAEMRYFIDFAQRTSNGISGYRVLDDLHKHSAVPLFSDSRGNTFWKHLSLPGDLLEIEEQLRNPSLSVALVCVNRATAIPQTPGLTWCLPALHSVTVGFDSGNFFAFDVNPGPGLMEVGSSLQVFGEADCLLFTQRQPAP